jgi:hypothetical protein
MEADKLLVAVAPEYEPWNDTVKQKGLRRPCSDDRYQVLLSQNLLGGPQEKHM